MTYDKIQRASVSAHDRNTTKYDDVSLWLPYSHSLPYSHTLPTLTLSPILTLSHSPLLSH